MRFVSDEPTASTPYQAGPTALHPEIWERPRGHSSLGITPASALIDVNLVAVRPLFRPAGDERRQLIVIRRRRLRRLRLRLYLHEVGFLGLLALAIDRLVICRHLLLLPLLVLEALAVGVHHPEVMLGVLIEVFGGD